MYKIMTYQSKYLIVERCYFIRKVIMFCDKYKDSKSAVWAFFIRLNFPASFFYKLQISGKFGQNIWNLWSNPKPGLISAQPAQQPVKNLLNFVKSSSPKLRQSTSEKIKAKRVKLEYESALSTKLGRGLISPDLENGFHKYMLLGKLQCRQCLFNVK